MSSLALFLAGLALTIVAGGGIVGLVLAAIADGREDDRIRAQQASETPLPR